MSSNNRIAMFRTTTPVTNSTRRTVQARATPPEISTIFQMNPPCGQVTLEDVDDIYPICNSMYNREQRYACYTSYGMDMVKVEKYYPIVKRLQAEINRVPPIETDRTIRLRLGHMHVTICFD